MIDQGEGGAIVNTSSICSVGMVPNMVGYSTAKAAVNHFTRYMAVELAPYDIRVNALLPGTFAVQNVSPEVQTWLHSVTPMKRPGAPEEIAPALLYLASDASSYVTGETLVLAGGGFISGA
jgi:NAD(P)-dependent dehydrogenase (short-subunit alcohol dehydrogenase family)